MANYAIYGCDGFAREVLPSLRKQISGVENDEGQIVFVDDDPGKIGTVVHGCKVISFDDLLNRENRNRLISVCIADPWQRRKIVDKCRLANLNFVSIRDSTHVSFDNVTVDEGAIFCAFTMATGDVRIGKHFHCNIYSYIAHDCRIGDFVTFAPRVCCNGRVQIDDYAYIGTGAMLKQGDHSNVLRIGRGAIIGMGAVVLKDVPDGNVVAGNPAKLIRKQNIADG